MGTTRRRRLEQLGSGLKPFFTYFGGKWRAAPKYPLPRHAKIVEPFAGSAGYALRHFRHDVTLVDADPVLAGLWRYLIRSTKREILALPVKVTDLRDMDLEPAAKWLIGFWLNKGSAQPCNVPSKWMRSGVRSRSYWGPEVRQRIADQVSMISHWKIQEGDYSVADSCPATWFIDPPYERSGKLYRKSSLEIDFTALAGWCKSRPGQVIVCEQAGAEWLPFRPFATIKATEGRRGPKQSREVIWTNE